MVRHVFCRWGVLLLLLFLLLALLCIYVCISVCICARKSRSRRGQSRVSPRARPCLPGRVRVIIVIACYSSARGKLRQAGTEQGQPMD
ncbi:hypothetical protein T492DRAFT_1073895 [Pavlovales sp. CCMP2436]|nr:hypothetical protein T492DRAFT_1073895 [Pavlovales sp. CCMP2436]